MTSSTTIAIFNHKGGVGKTTTTVNLAADIAHIHKKRVLVIDLDPQANATRALLGRELESGKNSIRTVLINSIGLDATLLDTNISGLRLAPADLSLSEAEFRLMSTLNRECILRDALRACQSHFDFVFVDCPPSLGLLSLNALAAADKVLVPCETQFLSLRGLRYVLDMLALVREKLNPRLKLLGVVATKFYILSKANNESLACLKDLQDVHLMNTVIGRDIRAEEAPSHGLPLILYAPDSRSSLQYLKLAEEVLELCRG